MKFKPRQSAALRAIRTSLYHFSIDLIIILMPTYDRINYEYAPVSDDY